MSKILILYATAGVGHKKAAVAIKEAFDRAGRKDVVLEDVLNYTTPFFRFSYNSVYLFLIKYMPTLWGFFYYILDNRFVYACLRFLRRFTNHINSAEFIKYLLRTKPETVITTHFFPVEVISYLKRKGVFKPRLITVITDYRAHSFWLSRYVDQYIVGSAYTKEDFIRRGISPGRIFDYGIPCAKSFSEKQDTGYLNTKTGLQPQKTTVFILGGGFGVGPIKRLVLCLDEIKEDIQAIVVCGYNERLRKEIQAIALTSRHKFVVYGFVDNVHELMAISDLLVSKPGGITVTEALSAGLPLVAVNPIPGQEMRNYTFLKKNNAAVKIKRPEDIKKAIADIMDKHALKDLKNNIQRIRRPDSADKIVDMLDKENERKVI